MGTPASNVGLSRKPSGDASAYGGVVTPADSGVLFDSHFGGSHFITGLGFQHVDAFLGLGDKVRLVFALVHAPLVEDLKLASCRLEPFERLAVGDDGEDPLGIGLEFLDRVRASSSSK